MGRRSLRPLPGFDRIQPSTSTSTTARPKPSMARSSSFLLTFPPRARFSMDPVLTTFRITQAIQTTPRLTKKAEINPMSSRGPRIKGPTRPRITPRIASFRSWIFS